MGTAGILGIGGWLVIHRQLTLGQLVASELVILILLGAVEKLVLLFQDWYDLLTSLDKVGYVSDLKLERSEGKQLPFSERGIAIHCEGLNFAYNPDYPILNNLDFSIQSGEVVSLVGPSGAGKSTLAGTLCGLFEPKSGVVEINGVDIRDIELNSLRQSVALVGNAYGIFEGTIEENIVLGRHDISVQDIRWALHMTQLHEKISQLPDGLQTRLISNGANLSQGQKQKLMIARSIVGRPKLLILDEAFTSIDERRKLLIMDALLAPQNNWTVIDISHDAEVVMRSHRILVLMDGNIRESGVPQHLIQNPNSVFASLFPELASRFNRGLQDPRRKW